MNSVNLQQEPVEVVNGLRPSLADIDPALVAGVHFKGEQVYLPQAFIDHVQAAVPMVNLLAVVDRYVDWRMNLESGTGGKPGKTLMKFIRDESSARPNGVGNRFQGNSRGAMVARATSPIGPDADAVELENIETIRLACEQRGVTPVAYQQAFGSSGNGRSPQRPRSTGPEGPEADAVRLANAETCRIALERSRNPQQLDSKFGGKEAEIRKRMADRESLQREIEQNTPRSFVVIPDAGIAGTADVEDAQIVGQSMVEVEQKRAFVADTAAPAVEIADVIANVEEPEAALEADVEPKPKDAAQVIEAEVLEEAGEDVAEGSGGHLGDGKTEEAKPKAKAAGKGKGKKTLTKADNVHYYQNQQGIVRFDSIVGLSGFFRHSNRKQEWTDECPRPFVKVKTYFNKGKSEMTIMGPSQGEYHQSLLLSLMQLCGGQEITTVLGKENALMVDSQIYVDEQDASGKITKTKYDNPALEMPIAEITTSKNKLYAAMGIKKNAANSKRLDEGLDDLACILVKAQNMKTGRWEHSRLIQKGAGDDNLIKISLNFHLTKALLAGATGGGVYTKIEINEYLMLPKTGVTRLLYMYFKSWQCGREDLSKINLETLIKRGYGSVSKDKDTAYEQRSSIKNAVKLIAALPSFENVGLPSY